jgi:hypothetical protein
LPFPFQIGPAEAYKYHYLGPGLFHKAPLSSIIKKELFDQVNGFAAIKMAGDFEMWHRLAKASPVVLMPQGIVWYREHENQEMNSYHKFRHRYDEISSSYLLDAGCPLEKGLVNKIVRSVRKSAYNELGKGLLSMNQARIKENWTRLNRYKHV